MQLKAAGYNSRKAYCGNVGPSQSEVCYSPLKIKPPCDGAADTGCCSTIGFDDINIGINDYPRLPINYEGLSWNNFFGKGRFESTIDPFYYTGFRYGFTSSPNLAFNGLGNSSSITGITDLATFSIKSLQATPVFSSLNLIFTGFDTNMKQIATYTIVVRKSNKPLLIEFDDSFENIHMFVLKATSRGSKKETILAMDDFVICNK